MNQSREPIYAALFALVSAAAPFVTASRRVRLLNEVQPSQLPALFMQQMGENALANRFAPGKYTLRVDLALYAQSTDANASAAPQLNALVDAVEAAITAQPQTLGGLASHCSVAGDIVYFEGTLGTRAGAIVPVEIVTT